MNITEVTSRSKRNPARKRVGRGEGSGLGKTSGRGTKGAGARAGHTSRFPAEGGAFPFFRRIPKVGFNNVNFRTEYQVVNVRDLEARFDAGAQVTAATLYTEGLIGDAALPVKILGDGEIKKKLTVEAQRFSADAEKKLIAAGCKVTKLGPQPKKKFVKRPPVKTPKEEGAEAPKAEGGKKAKKGGEGGEKPAKGKPDKAKPEQGEAAAE